VQDRQLLPLYSKHYNWRANIALQQISRQPGELQVSDRAINIHELTGNIMDSEM
jgi:hypothetical protein